MSTCDIFYFLVPFIVFLVKERSQRPEGGARSMNKYEVAVVVSARIEEEERANTIEKVKNYITRFGGTVTNIEECGKKRLAYEIQKMKEGFYYFIQFDADSACPAKMESSLRIMDNVIRYLVVRQEV